MAETRVIDADGHVTEPADLWERYLEPRYRSRAIRIARNDAGLEALLIDGKRQHLFAPGTLGILGGIGMDPERLLEPGVYTYSDACPPGGYDPRERLKVMDAEGIDVAVLYPTIGLTWEGHVEDPALAAAYCRAYNRWLVEFCSAAPDRPVGVPHISLADLDEAVREVRWDARAGLRGVFVRPDLVDAFHFAFLTLTVVAAFTSLLQGGTLERFPHLKVAILESGSGWLAHWLERLDSKHRLVRRFTPLRMPPSGYFERQCWISVEPDEATTPMMVELLGEDRFVWASDYPHVGASPGALGALRGRIAPLPPEARRKLLGANAATLYGLA